VRDRSARAEQAGDATYPGKRFCIGWATCIADPNSTTLLAMTLLVGAIVGVLAISSDSFWIDEYLSAHHAAQPTLAALWKSMLSEAHTDATKSNCLHIPLYFLVLWGWEKVAGTSEWALRMSNLPFSVLIALGLWMGFREQRQRLVFSLLFLGSSAFVWFYLNQLRPYALLLAESMWLLAAAHCVWRKPEEWNHAWACWFTFASLLVCATSMIGIVWVGSTILAVWYAKGRRAPLEFGRSFPAALCLLVLGFFSIAGYYAWSMLLPKTVLDLGRRGLMAMPTMMAYEYLGFAGLGPNRNALRSEALKALAPYAVPLATYAVLWIALCVYASGGIRKFLDKRCLIFYGLLILPAPVMVIADDIWNFRLLPRHLTPVMALVFYAVSFLLTISWRRGAIGRALVSAIFVVSMASAVQIRFAPRHFRDDYRYAAAIAKREINRGDPVLWAADQGLAVYYGVVPPNELNSSGRKVFFGEEGIVHMPRVGGIVLLSKPDIFDREGRIRTFMRDNGYHRDECFEAFELWRNIPSTDTSHP
jgi:hypothetical protein